MKIDRRAWTSAGAAMLLGGIAALAPLPAGAAPPAPAAKPPAFAACAGCHATKAGAPSTVGPNLSGVAGRKAAGVPGYRYSAAMKAQTFKWDRARLVEFITAPRTAVPGTTMVLGQADRKKAQAIADYLLTLK